MVDRSSNDGEYLVREYRVEDTSSVVSLLKEVFPGWPSSDIDCSEEEYYIWKYLDYGFEKIINHVATFEDEVIGAYHELYSPVVVNGTVYDSSLGSDVAVHPSFQGKGVWTALRRVFDKKHRDRRKNYIIRFMTGSPIVKKRMSKIRDMFPHTLSNMTYIKDINLHLSYMPQKNNLLIATGYQVLSLGNAISSVFTSPKRDSNDIIIQERDKFDDDIDIFWEKIYPEYNFITLRDKENLNHRFGDPRAGKFTILTAYQQDQLIGYIVYTMNVNIPNYEVGYIVDLLVLPGYWDAFDALVNEAKTRLSNRGVNIINYLVVKGHPYYDKINRHGFLDSRIPIQVFLNLIVVEETIKKKILESEPEKLFYSWGDHDSLPLGFRE